MLQYEEFSYDLLSGFVISGGSLSDTILKDAHGAIKTYLHENGLNNNAELERIGQLLVRIFRVSCWTICSPFAIIMNLVFPSMDVNLVIFCNFAE